MWRPASFFQHDDISFEFQMEALHNSKLYIISKCIDSHVGQAKHVHCNQILGQVVDQIYIVIPESCHLKLVI